MEHLMSLEDLPDDIQRELISLLPPETLFRLSIARRGGVVHFLGLAEELRLTRTIVGVSSNTETSFLQRFAGLRHATNLRHLVVDNRPTAGCKAFPDTLYDFIREVSFFYILFNASLDSSLVPNDLARLSRLESLDIINFDPFSDSYLHDGIKNLENLKRLNLEDCGDCNRDGAGKVSVESLCATLSSLRHLTDLNLTDFVLKEHTRAENRSTSPYPIKNQLGPLAASALIECLKSMTKLCKLSLPEDVSGWQSLNTLPKLEFLCLHPAELNFPEEDTESRWIPLVESFKCPVLFSICYFKDTAVNMLGAFGTSKLSVIFEKLRQNKTFDVNFYMPDLGLPALFVARVHMVIDLLFKAGADIDAEVIFKGEKYTPLLWAVRSSSWALASRLVRRGAKITPGPILSWTMDTRIVFGKIMARVKDDLHTWDDKWIRETVFDAAINYLTRWNSEVIAQLSDSSLGQDRVYQLIALQEDRIIEALLRLPKSEERNLNCFTVDRAQNMRINLRQPMPFERSLLCLIYKSCGPNERRVVIDMAKLTDEEIAVAKRVSEASTDK